jgi:hypothetical protein
MNILSFFGSTATFDATTPANPKVTFDFDGVKTASDFTTAPTSALTSGAKWFLAIVRTAKSAIDAITDNSNSVTIGNPTISVQTINNQLFDVYTYSIGFRIPRTAGSTPDPDNL